MLKKSDLLWLLAYPLYQVIGTLRHEGSHALAAVLAGVHIQEFVVLPSITDSLGFTWGYVRYQGHTGWWVTAAPYFVDLLTFLVFFVVCLKVRFRWRWVWLNLVILGIVSPLFNSLYNYLGGLFRNNDVGRLLAALPGLPVHVYFVGTLLLYAAGLWGVFKFSATRPARDEA